VTYYPCIFGGHADMTAASIHSKFYAAFD